MAVLFAFSLQHEVEKYGAYVGLAAFLGLAVLTVLYFAQARELKRLRDWAGRAPERAQEIEARVVASADELRRVPEPAAAASGTVGPAQPVAKPVPSGNGRGTGTPASIPLGPRPAVAVAAAAARAAEAGGAVATEDAPETTEDEAPEPAEVPVGEATQVHPAPTETDEPDEIDDTGEEAAAEVPADTDDTSPDTGEEEAAAPSGNGTGSNPPVIPRATPRPQPRPELAAPLRAPAASRTVPPRRPATPAPQAGGEGSSRAARFTLITVGGIVVVALLIFGATKLFGGGDDTPAQAPNVAQSPTGTADSANGGGSGSADVSGQRADTVVTVLNGTPTDGLAGTTRDKLVKAGYSDASGMVRTGNNTDQQRQDSIVYYAPGKRRMARDVAKVLGVTTAPEAIDSDTLALANNTGDGAAGHETDVVVIVALDQSP
jgi:LytR cell envelope-related transcriptional attenuator